MTSANVPHPETSEDDQLAHDLIQGGAVAVSGQQVAPAAAIGKALKDIDKINSTRQGNAQQAGFRAEVSHEATFNADAARKGLSVRAERTHHIQPSAAADIRLSEGSNIVSEVQVKTYKTVAGTTKAISAKKYDGMQKVAPADQAERVRELAAKRGVDGLGERNYADTSQKAAAQIEQGGASSKSLTYEQAQSKQLGARMLASETGTAAKSGAASGAVIGGAVSAVGNISAALKGEKSALQAAGSVAKDTVGAAVGGAVSAAATSALTAGCTRIGTQAMQTLSKGGAPGAIAATGIEVVKDLYKFGNGELTGTQVLGRGIEYAGGAGGAWAGAAAGAAIGSVVPVVGTVIGGIVGGMLGNAGARKAISGIKSLFS